MPDRRSDTLKRDLRGDDAVDALRLCLQDAQAFTILEEILGRTYSKFLGVDGARFAESYFVRLHALPTDPSADEVKRAVLSMRDVFKRTDLPERYAAFRRANLATSLSLIDEGIIAGRVADVGADDNALGQLLIECPAVTSVCGLDVERRNPIEQPPNLVFVSQESPSALPLPDRAVDTAICRYALHHMTFAQQIPILSEIRRILRPGGHLVAFENTCSLRSAPLVPDDLGVHDAIMRLQSWSRIEVLMAALDVFSLGFKLKSMMFPHAFRTVEEWRRVFQRAGFAGNEHYYGIPLLDLHQAPLAVFVLSPKARRC